MPIPLQVLIVEDNPADAELMVLELQAGGFDPDWRRVETEGDYCACLDQPPLPDVILSDYRLPDFDGLRALQLLQQRGLDIPFILVSGAIGEDVAVECMRQGAADYLLKDRLARLGLAVAHALEQKKLRDEKRRAEQALRDSERRFRALIEHSSDIIALIGAEGTILYESPSASRIVGYAPEELVGEKMFGWIHPDDLQNALNLFTQLLQEPGASVEVEFRYLHKDGTWRWLEGTATNLLAEPGVQALVANYRDVTKRKAVEEELRYLSTHDSLTGLYNRAYFEEELARLGRGRFFPVSIVMADVDDLKTVNDRQGHAAGDKLLQQAAHVLRAAFRAEDVVARTGGDEFAVVLPGANVRAVEAALDRLTRSLVTCTAAHIKTPLHLSLGTATAKEGESLTETLKQADAHMYGKKRTAYDGK